MGGFALGLGGSIFLFGLLITMLGIGYYSYTKRTSESLEDYLMANRGVGAAILVFSLFATQYSGNTMIGHPARAYRIGFGHLQFPVFMILVVVSYLLFMPRLYVLAKKYRYITVTDYLMDRYSCRSLNFMASLLMLWGIFIQFIEQMQATGTLFQGVGGGHTPYWVGVVFLGAVVLVYVMFGGMRGAVLVQAMQGFVMLLGVFLFVGYVLANFGSLGHAVSVVAATAPQKIFIPHDPKAILGWFSTLLLMGLGASLYASSIQQLFVAANEKTLKASLARMALFPLMMPLLLVFIGIIGAAAFPGLGTMESEQVVPLMIGTMMKHSVVSYWAMVIVFSAIIMATLSTASGVLISITSILVKDFYKGFINQQASDQRATLVARLTNIVAIIIGMLLVLKPSATLWRLMEIKFEGLVQVAPAIILGLYWPRANKISISTGLVVGSIIAIGLNLSGNPTFLGVHAGMWGLIANVLCVVVLSYAVPVTEEARAYEARFRSLFRTNAKPVPGTAGR